MGQGWRGGHPSLFKKKASIIILRLPIFLPGVSLFLEVSRKQPLAQQHFGYRGAVWISCIQTVGIQSVWTPGEGGYRTPALHVGSCKSSPAPGRPCCGLGDHPFVPWPPFPGPGPPEGPEHLAGPAHPPRGKGPAQPRSGDRRCVPCASRAKPKGCRGLGARARSS